MAEKYHVNPKTGAVSRCSARLRCPYGGEEAHYPSASSARQGYEHDMRTLVRYQDFYEQYNEPLREGYPLAAVPQAEELAEVIYRLGSQKEHGVLYRGVDPRSPGWVENLTVGTELTDLSFMSTSSSPDVAAWFATDEGGDCGVVFRILNGQAMPAAALPAYGSKQMKDFGLESEDEYLLPPGLSFRVTAMDVYEWDSEKYVQADIEYLPNR